MTKLVKPKKASPGRLEKAVTEAVVKDICNFHDYLNQIHQIKILQERISHRTKLGLSPENIAPISPESYSDSSQQELYIKMQKIADKYAGNPSLKNKLDEAERYIWPNGRRHGRH